MNNKLARDYTFGSLLRYALPTIIMMVFMSLYTMVDGMFVSRMISTSALSAVNIVFPLVSVVIAVGIMLATGASAIVAHKMGEGKPEEARADFTFIVVIGIVLGALITALGLVFLNPLLYALGANDAIFSMCRAYAYAILWFTAPAILQMLFQTFFVTAGRPGLGLLVTALGGVANIVLDYMFIGPLGWGIAGAAIATGIGYSIPAVCGLVFFAASRKDTLCFTKPRWSGKVLLHTCTNGASEMVTNLSTAIITYLFNIIMMRYLGEDGVAAITIVLYAEYLLVAVYLGYSTGIAPILSYHYGQKNTARLRRLFGISMRFIAISSAATVAGALLFAGPVVSTFAPAGTTVYTLARHGFYLYAAAYLFKGVNIFASSLFTALSDGKTSAILSFMRSLVFIVAGMALLPRLLGVDGVWLAVPFAEVLSLGLSAYCFRRLFCGFSARRDVEIRPITPENREAVLRLHPGESREDFIESTAACLREAAVERQYRPVALYAENTLIGFAMYGQFAEEGGRVWLDRLLIDHRFQRKGYGSAALRALIRQLQLEYRCGQIYLSVYRANVHARKLYKRAGFRRNGEVDTKGEEVMLLEV